MKFDLSVCRHSEFWGAADETVLNKVRNKIQKILKIKMKGLSVFGTWRKTSSWFCCWKVRLHRWGSKNKKQGIKKARASMKKVRGDETKLQELKTKRSHQQSSSLFPTCVLFKYVIQIFIQWFPLLTGMTTIWARVGFHYPSWLSGVAAIFKFNLKVLSRKMDLAKISRP